MNRHIEYFIYKLFSFFRKDFDDVSTRLQGETETEYGFIHGNNIIVFIKAGFHGTCYGYKNKYLKIARNLHKKHGCTVITASNPTGMHDDFEDEMQMLQFYAKTHGFTDYEVYFMGHSLGATLGIINAWKYPEIKKLICINGPLNDDPNMIIPAIKQFTGEKMILVYGDKDPTYSIARLYRELESDRMRIFTVHNTDHDFSNALKLFLALPEIFFSGEFPLTK